MLSKFKGNGLKRNALILTTFLVFSSTVFASKPASDRSLEACLNLLKNGARQRPAALAASSLISIGTLLKSRQAPYLAAMWRLGDSYSKEFPSAGLTHMFHTAEVAAQGIISHMGIRAVHPEYDFRDPISAHAATMELIYSKQPPEYIRNAVVVRDGVVVVIPILKRVAKKSSSTGKPSYIPIITKGHQELSLDDQLTAAFAAWALEPWLGALPKQAFIYLRPMAEVRSRRNTTSNALDARAMFVVDPKSFLPNIVSSYENFMKIASNENGLLDTVAPYRNGAVQNSPWASHVKELLEELDHPSMIPVPPTLKQVEILAKLGFDSLEKLALLEINSKQFFQVALTTEIDPATLRRFVGRAVAKQKNKILVSEPYDDPFSAMRVKRIVHIDFEDVLVHGIKSGVYIFGILIQAPLSSLSDAEKTLISKEMADQKKALSKLQEDPSAPILERDITKKTKTEVRRKKFIVAESLTQAGVDEAWARFIRFLKSYKLLKGNDFILTTYSKHEQVKFEQEMDILRDEADKFTPQQKTSEYYSEVALQKASGDEVIIGRLIRNKVFFKNYPDIKPVDVFNLIDNTYDLLEPIRKNLVFPTYTNSIKKVLDYAGTEDDQVRYPPGSNGLESMAWAFQYYQTREASVMDRALIYNGKDIDGNRLVSNLIREHAGEPQDKSLVWNQTTLKSLSLITNAVNTKRFVSQLFEKRELLETIMGRSLDTLAPKELTELAGYLDRTQYLQERKDAQERALRGFENEVKAEQQVLRFEMVAQRQENLLSFFTRINPSLQKQAFSPAIEAMSKLLAKPSQYLTPRHLSLMFLLETIETIYARLKIEASASGEDTIRGLLSELAPPANVLKYLRITDPLDHFSTLDSEQFPKPSSTDYKNIWKGLYYRDLFAEPKN